MCVVRREMSFSIRWRTPCRRGVAIRFRFFAARWANRRTTMTLQTDAFAIETGRSHVSFGVPGCSPLDFSATFGERMIRLAPKYADGMRDVRVRWALHGAAGAPAPVVIVQGGISADRSASS